MPAASAQLLATAQQSRFHAETLDTSHEIDLKDVTVSIGDRELVAPSHLRLKEGVRYALVGQCGRYLASARSR
jgi:ABC-type molybdenum transport system ATPase subunit/photorepair protein PhrA